MVSRIPPENRGSYAGVRTIANAHAGAVSFYSYNANATVRFKAFITSFRDSFKTSIGSETFVGHPEPLRKAKTIERVINMSFDVPAYDTSEAHKHLRDIKHLVQMLYPSYVETSAAGIPQRYVRSGGDPLFSIKFLNFIGQPGTGDVGTLSAYEDTSPSINKSVASSGLKGYIDGLNYDFDWTQRGGFLNKPGESQYLYPKLIKVSFIFLPFHETTPGWLGEGPVRTFSHAGVPYKLGSKTRGVAGPNIVPFDSAAAANASAGATPNNIESQVAMAQKNRALAGKVGMSMGNNTMREKPSDIWRDETD